jgi:hypothetical protein
MKGLLLACILAVVPATGADRGFREIVDAISGEFQVQPTRIPFAMGLANAVLFFARPAGTSHIELAVFENLDPRRREGRDLPGMIRSAVGSNWKPFVQVFSRRKGQEENVFIFLRNEGRDCKLLIASVERREATVVQLRVNQEALERMLAEPRGAARWR